MTEPTTIRTLLAIANKLDLNVDHLDIKTAFLNGILPPDEQFYCSPPPGLTIPSGFCWKILRGLYGAHQSDSALELVDNFEALLNLSFEATPREPVDQYLGMHVTRNREQRYLSIDGRRHVRDFIHSMGFDPKASTTVRTPLDPTIVYSKEDCPAEVDIELRAKDFRLTFGTTDTEGIDGLYGYTDSDWAADLDHRKSTGAYLFLLDGASCSWKVKLSPTVCLSTQQAEYYALTEGTKEALNLRFLLRDLGFGQSLPTLLFCDNKGAITMSLHPANKPATRHIDMRIHFCRQHVEQGDVTTKFAPTPAMLADFMTKQTLRLTHERHCRRAFGDQSAPLPLEPIARVLA